jgi:hypothetical protein
VSERILIEMSGRVGQIKVKRSRHHSQTGGLAGWVRGCVVGGSYPEARVFYQGLLTTQQPLVLPPSTSSYLGLGLADCYGIMCVFRCVAAIGVRYDRAAWAGTGSFFYFD